MKLKASALSFAVFVVFIIGIAMSSMLLMQSSSDQILLKHSIQRKLIHNAESGVLHFMMNSDEIENEMIADLFGTGLDSTLLQHENWGAFKMVHSKAFARRDTFKKSAFIGEKLLKESQTVLYLADKNSPLSICGQTEIRGEVYLPKSGVKRAYIEGQNYNGQKLIYGSEKQSERFLPDLNADIKALLKDPFYNQKEMEQMFYEEIETDSIHFDFSSRGIHLYSLAPIYIADEFFSGKIKIESTQSIRISREANLKDVILIAPEIIIESDFIGNVQLFAEEVLMKEGAILEHPSMIMISNESEEIGPELIIEDDTVFEGTIVALGKQRAPAQVLIEKGAINGFIYNNGLTQVKGKVNGALYSSELILKTASSIYKNHLLNVELSMDDQVREECFPNILSRSKFNTVAKWLN